MGSVAMSPLLFLMLVICVFPTFFLVILTVNLLIIDLFKEPTPGFVNFLYWFLVFSFIDLCSNFYSVFSSAYFGLNLSSFSSFLSWKLTLLILGFFPPLIYAFYLINFPLSTVFLLLFSSKYFKLILLLYISLISIHI